MEKKETKKPGKIATFFLCLLVIIAGLLSQVISSAILTAIETAKAISNGSIDINGDFQSAYTAFFSNSDILQRAEFVALLTMTILASLWYYFVFIKKEKKNGTYESVIPKIKDEPLTIPFLVIASIACFSCGSIIDIAATAMMPNTAALLEKVFGAIINDNIVLTLMSVVILAPLGEEIIDRGIIAKISRRSYGMIGCMVISAVMFAIFHMNPIQGLYVIPMGLFWGYLAYKYKSVIPSMFCHAFNNLMGVYSPSSLIEGNKVVIHIIVMLIAGAAAFYIGSRIKILTDKPSEQISSLSQS